MALGTRSLGHRLPVWAHSELNARSEILSIAVDPRLVRTLVLRLEAEDEAVARPVHQSAHLVRRLALYRVRVDEGPPHFGLQGAVTNLL